MDAHGHCQGCEASCTTCLGPTQEDCTSCPLTRVLDDGRCVVNCPSWKFGFRNQCHPCHHTCQGCQGRGPFNCTSCRADKHGREYFLYQGECRESCPVGYYPTKENACLPCPDNCELCQSPHVCTRCLHGFFLLPTNHTCQKLECGQGEVEDSDYEECLPCEEGCLGCTVDDPGTCTSCAATYYMFEHHCYKTCPEKTFSEEWTCKSCNPNCGSCDQNECYWCEEGFFLSGGSCVQECEPGFYSDQEVRTCEPCHQACKTCTGFGYDECTSCGDGLQLRLGMCLPPTQAQVEGKFWNDASKQNQRCHSSCQTCNGSATLCTSCPKGAYLLAQACVSSCPQGTWASARSGSCEECMEGCASCSAPDLCETCQTQSDIPRFLHEGRCYSRCPEHFYAKDGLCEPCGSPCRTCEGNATNCHSCKEEFVLSHGECQEACPERQVAVDGVCKHCPEMCQECLHEKTCKECMPGFFLHEDTCHESCPQRSYSHSGQCVPCHKDCLQCHGPTRDDCELCIDIFKLFYNGQCLDECPVGTYEEEMETCQDCPKSCHTCSSSRNCNTCREGFKKTELGTCVLHSECATIEYWDEDRHRCQPCHQKCLHCSGPKEDQCYTCPRNSLLLNATCMENCPEGYYSDEDNHRCVPCHSSCRTCEGQHSLQCLSCRPGWFQLGKECLLQCRDGYYPENTSGQCKKCDKSCKACRGPKSTDCLSCDKFFFLLRSKGQCYRTCPKHYHAEQSTQTCERCHPTCDECNGKQASECLSCVWSYHLMRGFCNSDCLPGKYRVGEGERFDCENCHESCMECKGSGNRNCTMCPAGLLLLMDDSRCLRCCNASSPTDSQDCCDCQETTEECILPAGKARPAAKGSKTALLAISSVLLVLLLGASVVIWKKHWSRAPPVEKAGYEKLSDPSKSHSSYKSSYLQSTSFEDQVIEYRDQDYDEDDEDDIVYMSQDGTVYRKFKYGLLDDDDDGELEYDDESYSY